MASAATASNAYRPRTPFQPIYNPNLTIEKVSGAIKIDGELDDAGWRNINRQDKFVERNPGDMIEPDVRTEFMVTYDDKNLYVAFICYDDPSSIRATMCQHDQFQGDDAVYVLIDTYADAEWAYEFIVNPYGIQKDRLWTSTFGEDGSFDLTWESSGKITPAGFQVEIAIPFSSLRFPNRDVQKWKMDFWRGRPREVFKQYSWAAYDRNEQCWPCQWGTIDGIGNVEPGKGVELLGAFVTYQSGRLPSTEASFDNSAVDGDFSIGGKYALTSDITMEGTYNPDFSHIEADAAQIDVNSTIALLYPEQRPFFQEGADIFRTLFNSFDTKTVKFPEFAGKLTGRSGPYTIGYFVARDEKSPYTIPLEEGTVTRSSGKSTINVVRGSRSFGQSSNLGFMFTDRRFDGGGYGTIMSVDGRLRLSQNYSAVGQYIMSYTGEPDDSLKTVGLENYLFDHGKYTAALDGEEYSGNAFIAQLRRRGRHLNMSLTADQVDASYRTQTGYDPWNNYRSARADASYTFYAEDGLLDLVQPNLHFDRRWDTDGTIKWTDYNLSCFARFRFAQTYTSGYYRKAAEKWGGIDYDDLWRVGFSTGSRFSDAIGYDMSFGYGREVAVWLAATGHEFAFSSSIDYKPIDRILIEPNVRYVRSHDVDTEEELYEQLVARVRVSYQYNRRLSMRLVVQHNDASEKWDIDPLVTYRISPFSVFYFGSTYDYSNVYAGTGNPTDYQMTSRQFFMKIQYLFQT